MSVSRDRLLLLVAPLLAAWFAVAAYWGGLGNGFTYDDEELILSAEVPASAGEWAAVLLRPHYRALPYYRPLTTLSYVAQKAFAGDAPFPYHAANACLAGLLALAAWWALRRFGEVDATLAAVLAAAWAVHPATSAAVYAISGREALMSTAMVLCAFAAHQSGRTGVRASAGAWFLAALLVREAAIAAPLAFALRDAMVRRYPGWREWARGAAPFVGALAIYAPLRIAALDGTGASADFLPRLVDVPLAYLYAAQSYLMPTRVLVYEPLPDAWFSAAKAVGVLAMVAGAAAAGRKWLPPEARRPALFGLVWFAVAMMPTANVLRQEAPFAERHALLPSFGLLGAAAMLLGALPRGWALVAGWMAAAALAPVTLQRASAWRNDLAFHSQWAATSPGRAQARASLAWALIDRGRLEEAEAQLGRALALDPANVPALANLAYLRLRREKNDEAAALLERALAADPENYPVLNMQGTVLHRRGDIDGAAALFRRAAALRPSLPDANNNLGDMAMLQGDYFTAIESFQRALAARPAPQLRAKLGEAYFRAGSVDDARRAFQEALDEGLDTAILRNNLGIAEASLGNAAKARAHFLRALELAPDDATAKANLARLGL